jgi:hypothetical protein
MISTGFKKELINTTYKSQLYITKSKDITGMVSFEKLRLLLFRKNWSDKNDILFEYGYGELLEGVFAFYIVINLNILRYEYFLSLSTSQILKSKKRNRVDWIKDGLKQIYDTKVDLDENEKYGLYLGDIYD